MRILQVLHKYSSTLFLCAALLHPICWAQEAPPPAAEASGEGKVPVLETVPLLRNGSFEDAAPGAAQPADWQGKGAREWRLEKSEKVAGAHSLAVEAGDALQEVSSLPIACDAQLKSVSGIVMVQGPLEAGALLRWWAESDQSPELSAAPLREDAFQSSGSGTWRRLTIAEQSPPEEARALQLVLVTPASASPVYWDQAQLTAMVERHQEVKVLINQLGYEVMMPKNFMVAANFQAGAAHFRVLDMLDNEVFSAELSGGDPIPAGKDLDWGMRYWRGDFSALEMTGSYVIEVELEDALAVSPVLEIGQDLLWARGVPLIIQCFQAHRCGEAVAGVHEACHLDDAAGGVSLAGGWHDGSQYGKTASAAVLWKLGEAVRATQWRLRDKPEGNALDEELRRGAELVLKALPLEGEAAPLPVSPHDFWGPPESETDNVPASGDERHLQSWSLALPLQYAAALSRVQPRLREASYLSAVARGLAWGEENLPHHPLCFATQYNVFQATGDSRLAPLLQVGMSMDDPNISEELIAYASNSEDAGMIQMVMRFKAQADSILAEVRNVFGLYPYDAQHLFPPVTSAGAPGEGNTRRILSAAETVAKIYRLAPQREYLQFVYDQLNWLLGVNPEGVSLMAGAGTQGLPSYYHPYATCGLAGGIVPGAIANGFGAQGKDDDRPYIDLSGAEKPAEQTNGVELLNEALFFNTLAQLKRIPVSAAPAPAPGAAPNAP